MKRISKFIVIFIIGIALSSHAGNTPGNGKHVEKKDSTTVVTKPKDSKKFANIKSPTNIPANKTNWSKIKDLFM